LQELNYFKFCSGCKEFKYISEFYKDKGKRNGLDITCKACRSKYSKEYYQKTKKSKLSGGSGLEYSCLECGKAFWGWSEDNTCPYCGG